MNQAAGTITHITGRAWVRHADGSMHALRLGDRILEAMVIVTEANSGVELLGAHGHALTIGAGREVLADINLLAQDVPAPHEAAVRQLDDNFDRTPFDAVNAPSADLDPNSVNYANGEYSESHGLVQMLLQRLGGTEAAPGVLAASGQAHAAHGLDNAPVPFALLDPPSGSSAQHATAIPIRLDDNPVDTSKVLIDGPGNETLTGGSGASTFVWRLESVSVKDHAPVDTITDFGHNGKHDVLDLSDLLQGESHNGNSSGNLTNYLHIEQSGGDAVIHISSQGGFSTGYSSRAEDQTIVLRNVDLTQGGALHSDQQIITDLFKSGKLHTD